MDEILIDQAIIASDWPDWLHDIVDRVMDGIEDVDLSTEQAIALGILLYIDELH